MPPCEYIMTQNALVQTQCIQKKNPFIFKTRLPQHLKSKYSQILIYYSWKVIFFLLKAPKKLVITVRTLRMGHWLRIWWSGSKDLFSQFSWAKGVARFQGLFLEKWILWKSSILKRFIFLVSEYSNLTGIKTHLW